MRRVITKHISVLFLLLILTSVFAFSQELEKKHSILTDKFDVGIGFFYPSKTFKVGVNGSSDNNEIEFGEAFGLEDCTNKNKPPPSDSFEGLSAAFAFFTCN